MKVVHCKREPYDIYIGRPSVWGNPYIIGPDGDRAEVIVKYEAHMRHALLQTRLGVTSAAIPQLGCGLGGLEWPRVRDGILVPALQPYVDWRFILIGEPPC